MKYCKIYELDFHCDDCFNWVAVDNNGDIYFYEEKPYVNLEQGYWDFPCGNNYRIILFEHNDCPNWLNSLVKL